MNVQIFGGNNPNDGPNCLYIVTLNMGQAGWAACAVFENKSTLIKVENQSWIVMSGRRCWDGGPRQCLLSPPPRSNTAQPSPVSQARPSWEWMNAGLGWLSRTAAHSTPELQTTELQSYRVLLPHSHTELSRRVALTEAPLQLYTRQSKYLQCLQQEASPVPSVL